MVAISFFGFYPDRIPSNGDAAMELPKILDMFGLFWMFNEVYFPTILPQRIS